jgi:Haem-binding domain
MGLNWNLSVFGRSMDHHQAIPIMKGKIRKILMWLFIVGGVVFLLAQLIRPVKTNPVSDPSLALESHLTVDARVSAILDRSCADCHSNRTRWPWYTNVAPVSWFVINHVNDGRRDLNFSEWGRYDRNRQRRKLDEMCELVREGAMPLGSYTPLHPGSSLTDQDIKTLCDWTIANAKH